jgi:hypothetical protein
MASLGLGALDEPAFQGRRQQDEPLLGHGAVGATDNVTLLYSHRYLLDAPNSRRGTNWRCPTGWPAIDGLPLCLHRYQLTQDRADALRAEAAP